MFAGVLVSINANKPFIGQHDWNGVVYGQQAKNFLRFGYFPLKFGGTLATADILPKERKYLTHYTSVLPILISFSYRLFGVSEWSTRLVPAAASLASVFLVILLGRELISFRAGIIAGILMAVTPMFIYYGKNPVHEVVLLPFALLAFYSYLRWRRGREGKWWKILLVSVTLAMLIGWSGYYAAGLIAGHGFLTGEKERARFLVLPALTAGLFLAFLFHVSVFSPDVGNELQRAVTARMGGGGFGMKEFMARELRYSINLFTVILLELAGIWTIGLLIKLTKILPQVVFSHCEERQRRGNLKTRLPRSFQSLAMTVSDQILLGLIGIFGITHVLLFRGAGWDHEYLLFPFLPFVVLAAAGVIEHLLRVFPDLRVRVLIVGFVLTLAASERLGYLQALLKSEYVRDIYSEAVEFAKEERWKTERIPEERDVYFIFYADRKNI